MLLKFIGNDGQTLVVQTNSYQVVERSSELKFVLVNVVKSDQSNGESPTEFTLSQNTSDSWGTCYVMNDRGETVDRVSAYPRSSSLPAAA